MIPTLALSTPDYIPIRARRGQFTLFPIDHSLGCRGGVRLSSILLSIQLARGPRLRLSPIEHCVLPQRRSIDSILSHGWRRGGRDSRIAGAKRKPDSLMLGGWGAGFEGVAAQCPV